jgi:lipopolysaccharide transport system permease protein
MYLSPVIYPVTLVPEEYRWILILNPMTGIIDGFRSVLLNRPIEWTSLGVSASFAIVALVAGLFLFRRTENQVIDVA